MLHSPGLMGVVPCLSLAKLVNTAIFEFANSAVRG
jgi:hypothetical protein